MGAFHDVRESGDLPAHVESYAEQDRPEDRVLPRRSPGFFADPVVVRLAWVGGLMLLAFLATVVSALAFGVINAPAPRTSLEQKLTLAEIKIDAGSVEPVDWYDYITALISSEQYAKAQRMIRNAQDAGIDDPAKQYLMVAKVRLDIARRDYEAALDDSAAAMSALETQLAVEQERYQATKRPTTMIADGLGENYEALRLNRAEAFEGLDRLDEAIASLDDYLAENGQAADILVWRGDLKAAAGDTTGAIADYRAASAFMPGDDALLQKLKGLGVTDE